MSTVVVFESMFGNTEKVARAVADGIRTSVGDAAGEVSVFEVGRAPDKLPDEVRLLVAGGPTHAFGMTRPTTREDARKRIGQALVSSGIGLREWLETFSAGQPGLMTVTFDTRIDKVRRLPGSAARGAAKALRRRGYRPLTGSRSFYVADTEGPLVLGEIEQARKWGREIGQAYLGTLRRTTA